MPKIDMSVSRPSVSLKGARAMLDRAISRAEAMSTDVTIVIVDESGTLKSSVRMDRAPLVSVQTAMSKAYAAAAIGMPPDEFYGAIRNDDAAVASFATRPGLALIAGGLPLFVGGQVAGAVGVAGAMTGSEDREIAESAVAAFAE
jgi:uncharacterized protein GlcG (DUF336 family)